jgi:hypothetical protein
MKRLSIFLVSFYFALIAGIALAGGGSWDDPPQQQAVPQSKVIVVAPPENNESWLVEIIVGSVGGVAAIVAAWVGVRGRRKDD